MARLPLNSGDLDRRVTILRAAAIDDGLATVAGEPAPIGQRWASKYDVSDRERIAAAQQGADLTTRFVMRWDSLTSTISAADTLLLDSTTYQIVGKPKELGRREGVEITAASV